MSGKSLNHMIRAMEAVGRYSLEENTLVYGEIWVYSVMLERIRAYFEEIFRECFVQSAMDKGLFMRENAFATEKEEVFSDLDSRRKKLIKKLSHKQGEFSSYDFIEEFLNIDNTFRIEVEDNRLLLLTNDILSLEQITRISRLLSKCLSVHARVGYQGGGKSFSYWEQQSLTWNFIDKNSIRFDIFDTI